MLNRIIIMGRLTRDPELRRTQSGTAVTSFSLAVERDFRSQSGEKETDFIDVVAWRNTAEFVNKYFSKGRTAVVEGRLQIREWTDQEGRKRRSAEVVADNIYFGDSKRENSDNVSPYYSDYGPPPQRGGRESSPSSEFSGRASGGVSAPRGGYHNPSDFSDMGEDGELPF